jgi:15-cis-phytoene synthase
MHADDGADLAACRRLMRGGSKSFFAASLLLPARVRAPASALYAFCRVADDKIDLGGDPHAAADALRRRLDAVYAGRPDAIACDRALAAVVRAHAIPRALLDALLEGFVWDADGRRYDSLDEVHAYGARVAGTVGAMMALLMGVRSEQALARACELGVAMQLTNIARDVGEDARNGRLYLPRQWLAAAGVDAEAWLRAPRFDAAIGRVVGDLLAAADALYARAEHGIAALPRDCRPAIRAARLVYAEIGARLRRDGLDSVSRRTIVPSRRKLALMARAGTAAWSVPGDARVELEPLPAIAHLVVAAAPATLAIPATTAIRSTAATPPRRRPPERSLDERVGWVLELFERQAAQRAAR